MLCERCHQNEATMTLTRTINNKKTVTHLCPQCAREEGAPLSTALEGFGNILSGLMGLGNLWTVPKAAVPQKRCPKCGMTADEITSSGKLGCAECYVTFIDEMRPLLRKIHGNCVHHGTVPGQGAGRPVEIRAEDEKTGRTAGPELSELDSLRRQMKDAIAREDFESAARLRDRIKELTESEGK